MPAAAVLKPRKTPRQERARRTVAAILAAAAQVFERRGYAAGTTDAIAERAGVSIGSLYQYFPNKDAILVALAERHLDEGFELMEGMLALAAPDPPELEVLLRGFVEAMIALHRREPRLHRVLFEEAPLPASLRRSLAQREEALAERVARLLDAHPDLALPDPRAAAYLLVRSVEGLVHGFILHPPKHIDPEAFEAQIVRLLERYLR
jgi:AcrR family transcriptional regulator